MLCLASISAEVEDALHRSRQGHKVALLHCVGARRAQHTCDCMATSWASSLTKLPQARTDEGLLDYKSVGPEAPLYCAPVLDHPSRTPGAWMVHTHIKE